MSEYQDKTQEKVTAKLPELKQFPRLTIEDTLRAEIDYWKSKYLASVNERHEIMQELEALRGEK